MPTYHIAVTERLPSAGLSPKRPLLFIHGTGHGAWCWEEHFLPYFADHGYAAYALDIRGHGQSEGRDALMTFRLEDYIEDVLGVARTLQDQYGRLPILLGHSLGGLIIERVIDTDFLPLEAAVLIAPIPRGAGWNKSMNASLQAFGLWRLMRMLVRQQSALMYETPAVMRRAFFAPDMPPEQAEVYWRRMQPESWMHGDVTQVAPTKPPHPAAMPMLVICGALDRVFPPAVQQITAGYYQAEIRVIEGVGHELMLDVQWERAADVIEQWLAAHP